MTNKELSTYFGRILAEEIIALDEQMPGGSLVQRQSNETRTGLASRQHLEKHGWQQAGAHPTKPNVQMYHHPNQSRHVINLHQQTGQWAAGKKGGSAPTHTGSDALSLQQHLKGY